MRLGEERAEGYLPGIANGQPETKVQEEGEKAAALPFPLNCAQKLILHGLKSRPILLPVILLVDRAGVRTSTYS